MHDFCPIRRIDHLEFYVGNARQAAFFYANCLGFTNTAYRGLETGSRSTCSYLMEQSDIRFVLTSPLVPDHPIARFVHEHGDGVGAIALDVPDATAAFRETTARGAVPALDPSGRRDERGTIVESAIHVYGDTLIRFVERSGYRGGFWPGFRSTGKKASRGEGVGLDAVDHVVGNVELGAMETWVRFFAETMGFNQLVHFDDKTITTEYSALMSKVMQDGSGRIKFPINEPATGKRKSQIQEYLDYYRGPGVQHIALATTDIIDTVYNLRSRGLEFLRVPPTYYEELSARIGPIDEPIDKLAELGILADRDEEGYLLQIFTEVVEDRPTVFFEVIERHGSRGFGEGNFKSLFEAIEREQARRGNLV